MLVAACAGLLATTACIMIPQIEIFNGTDHALRVGWMDDGPRHITWLPPSSKARVGAGRRFVVESSNERRMYDFGPESPACLARRTFFPFRASDGLFARPFLRTRLQADGSLWLVPKDKSNSDVPPFQQPTGFPLQGSAVEMQR
jgi:hypothetical protein